MHILTFVWVILRLHNRAVCRQSFCLFARTVGVIMSAANGSKLQIMKSNSADKSVEEKFQLLRVFRLLAFEIPLQRVEQKLQV